jgi:hypothetical protein
MIWMNDDFLLDISVKLFYTDDVCPLNSLQKLHSVTFYKIIVIYSNLCHV